MLLFQFYANILSNIIINEYFATARCLLIYQTNITTSYMGQIPAVKFTDFDESIFTRYFGCQGVIVESDQAATRITQFEEIIRSGLERFNERKYLILLMPEESYHDIFSLEELNYVSDILVVSPHHLMADGGFVFDLLTHQYVGLSGNNKTILLDKWFSRNQSFLYNNDLYPDKLRNQFGRPLRMATFTYEPYSIVGETVDSFYGSELSTAVQYALKHNMTPVPVVNEEDYWGEIYKNWSGNGLLGNLVMDKADVGFSALYTWEICYHYLDLSKPLVRTGITCIVPSPKLAAGWLTPLFSYTADLWMALGITMFIIILTFSLIRYFYKTNNIQTKTRSDDNKSFSKLLGSSTLYVVKPFLIQSLTKSEIPDQLNCKFITFLILILSIFLTSSYSSGLSSIMTIPRYEAAIDTPDDLVDSGVHWGATQEAWITSIEGTDEPKYVKIVSRFITASEENLREYSKLDNFALSLERLPYDNYAVAKYIKKDVIQNYHLMQEDLYWEQCVIMTKKSSIILPSLDKFILNAFEAGLISYWQNKAVLLYMDSDVQKAVKYYKSHKKEQTVVKLKWIHVEGAFAALGLGYCLSMLMFLFELVWYKYGT